MPPKTLPLSAQPAPVQDTLGMNPDYMLPHQRDQFRRHLQTVTDLNNRRSTEPNNPQIDAAIAEARGHLTQLAAQAAQNEKMYPTKEAFQQYATQINKTLQLQAQALASRPPNVAPRQDNLNALRIKHQSISNRVKEIDELLNKPDLSDDQRAKLRNEHAIFNNQLEQIRDIIRSFQGQPRLAAAGGSATGTTNTGSQSDATATGSPATPPLSQTQPATPTVRNMPPTSSSSSVAMQQSSSQPNLPTTISMGQLPRPSVNTAVPPPRPTLTGGYPVGNPLLGTAAPGGVPGAFQLAQDGDSRLLSKRKLQDLVKSIDPDERLEPDVEEV